MNQSKRKVMVAPSILSGNFTRIESEIRKIEEAGADMIHLDIMDGHFVPNITFGAKMVADIRKITKLPLDAHLMIFNPEKYIDSFIAAGADYITIHTETTSDAASLLSQIKNKGVKCGIAFNPDKTPEVIENVAEICDLVLVMSVFPGFSGQKYIESRERVARVREILDNHGNNKCVIQIDGGIGLSNASVVFSKGADILVMGNAFFAAGDPKSVVDSVRSICK